MSELLVEDCEAYKDFLALPYPLFVGPKMELRSARWRPFATDALTPELRRSATPVLRAAFKWRVDVRYLAGNPWKVVNDSRVIRRRPVSASTGAVPTDLWERAREFMDRARDPAG